MGGLPTEFAIPIDTKGRILNGAHRLSVALALQLEYVPVVRILDAKYLEWGMNWFLANDFDSAEISSLLQLWIDAHPAQAQWLIIEHNGSDIPAELMHELQ